MSLESLLPCGLPITPLVGAPVDMRAAMSLARAPAAMRWASAAHQARLMDSHRSPPISAQGLVHNPRHGRLQPHEGEYILRSFLRWTGRLLHQRQRVPVGRPAELPIRRCGLRAVLDDPHRGFGRVRVLLVRRRGAHVHKLPVGLLHARRLRRRTDDGRAVIARSVRAAACDQSAGDREQPLAVENARLQCDAVCLPWLSTSDLLTGIRCLHLVLYRRRRQRRGRQQPAHAHTRRPGTALVGPRYHGLHLLS